MSTAELKDLVIKEIKNLENKEVLERLLAIAKTETSGIYVFTNTELAMIAEADEDIKYGRVISHEDATKNPDKWL